MIRLQFHAILSNKEYPTISKLLSYLKSNCPDFPTISETTLWRHIKRLGFVYKKASKVMIPLDDTSFVAARAKYFRMLDGLRENNAIIFYQDETWSVVGDEKRNIWIADDGSGRLKKSNTKGKTSRICLIMDNAPWHSQQTDESKLPTRASRKEAIENWLSQHDIEYESSLTKAELLEIVIKFAPPRRYKVDEAAKQFGVEILRLPVRHSVLNPIELAWAGLKNYIRNNNTDFRLVDIHNLAVEYLAAVDEPLSTSYFRHVKKYEDTFKAADKYVQEVIEATLDQTDDETIDDSSNDVSVDNSENSASDDSSDV
ncbi:unnamed protein product [Rotaria sordida]|uniref:Uncharacterized protein n=1 Tax=Rotaria sordida TaxID=392033 RepID=A0A815T353_9BILA|nr:unnamed protein product [Rotaria sordida]CAF4177866.1 unnamed protein product [Rotaria sordida]